LTHCLECIYSSEEEKRDHDSHEALHRPIVIEFGDELLDSLDCGGGLGDTIMDFSHN
jgi:hypothetical protein